MPISIILPLGMSVNGYLSLNDDEKRDAVKQNFKFLLLTRPGEYTMLPNFGVGLSNYLFDLSTVLPEDEIISRIYSQTAEYMPYIIIHEAFITMDDDMIDRNSMLVTVKFSLSDTALIDIMELRVEV